MKVGVSLLVPVLLLALPSAACKRDADEPATTNTKAAAHSAISIRVYLQRQCKQANSTHGETMYLRTQEQPRQAIC